MNLDPHYLGVLKIRVVRPIIYTVERGPLQVENNNESTSFPKRSKREPWTRFPKVTWYLRLKVDFQSSRKNNCGKSYNQRKRIRLGEKQMSEPQNVISEEYIESNQRQKNVSDFEKSVILEISKLLLSSSLESIRGTIQVLQGLTGLLLTSYIALFLGLGKTLGLDKLPLFASILPILLLVLSLGIGFGMVVFYPRS